MGEHNEAASVTELTDYLSHIYAKLGVANRAELASQATPRGLARKPC